MHPALWLRRALSSSTRRRRGGRSKRRRSFKLYIPPPLSLPPLCPPPGRDWEAKGMRTIVVARPLNRVHTAADRFLDSFILIVCNYTPKVPTVCDGDRLNLAISIQFQQQHSIQKCLDIVSVSMRSWMIWLNDIHFPQSCTKKQQSLYRNPNQSGSIFFIPSSFQ